jgi:hypothetical protein
MAVLVLLVLAACSSLAFGQAAPSDDDALRLACLTVHEAGVDALADASLIHAVVSGIAERDRVSYRRAMALAAPRWARCEVRRTWTCGLMPDGSRPAGWPMANWERSRPRWLALLEHARAVVRGEVPLPCAEPPRVWGSVEDRARGERRGHRWRDAGCVGTRNVGGSWR